MQALFHLVDPGVWESVVHEYRPESLALEGFVHCSFAGQVADAANRHYPDVPALVAVELDPTGLDAEVIVEDSYGSGTAFPHVYGPVPVAAAVAVHPMRRGPDRRWLFSPGG